MNIRKNVSNMSTAEKAAFVNAVLALKADTTSARPAPANAAGAQNRYDVYVWIHSMVMNAAHKGAAFTPWHREFLRQFELELQDVSGNPKMTIPYWDCVKDRTASDPGYPFTANFMGGMGTGTDNRVNTGAFAERAGWVLNVISGQPSGTRRDNTNYLRRRTGQNPNQLPETSDLNLALRRTPYDTAPFAEGGNRPSPSTIAASFRKILEYDLHNGPHEWIGGNMLPHTAPNDPVFYLHHSNIDRIWAIWQQRLNGGITNYQPNTGIPLHSLTSIMAMLNSSFYRFPVLNRPLNVLNHKALGYMYDLDLPMISGVPETLNFGMVQNGSTVQLPINFTIEAGRNMKFQIGTFAGDPGFRSPAGSPAYEIVHHTEGDPQTHDVQIAFRASSQPGTKNGMVQINVYVWDSHRYYSNNFGDYLAGSWSVNLEANVVSEIPVAIVFEPNVSPNVTLETAKGNAINLLNGIEDSPILEKTASGVTVPETTPSFVDGLWTSVAVPSNANNMSDMKPSLPDNLNMDKNMELVSFKVNENGELNRVIFTHDEPCKEPKHTKRKSASRPI